MDGAGLELFPFLLPVRWLLLLLLLSFILSFPQRCRSLFLLLSAAKDDEGRDKGFCDDEFRLNDDDEDPSFFLLSDHILLL